MFKEQHLIKKIKINDIIMIPFSYHQSITVPNTSIVH